MVKLGIKHAKVHGFYFKYLNNTSGPSSYLHQHFNF